MMIRLVKQKCNENNIGLSVMELAIVNLFMGLK